jgi:hypothetical protein
VDGFKCKRMQEGFLGHCKAALSNLISSDAVKESEDPLKAFAEAIVNFHSHYCLDVHSSPWCHHEKVMTVLQFRVLINDHQSFR